MTDVDVVVRAQRILEGVTEGPWWVQNTVACFDVIQGGDRTSDSCHIAQMGFEWRPPGDSYPQNFPYPNGKADGEFIAASRSLVPELVAEVERLRDLVHEADWLFAYHGPPPCGGMGWAYEGLARNRRRTPVLGGGVVTTPPTPLHVIREAIAFATKGPWWRDGAGYIVSKGDSPYRQKAVCDLSSRTDFTESDAHLIANAPSWLAELVGRCEQAEGALTAAVKIIDGAMRGHLTITEADAALERARRVLGA